MTENEAINELQSNIDLPFGFTVSDEVSEIAIKALEEIKQYRTIGTVEELKALKEKNEPKSPLRIPTDDTCLYYELRCPSCNAYMSGLIEMHHCTCGQRLSWE